MLASIFRFAILPLLGILFLLFAAVVWIGEGLGGERHPRGQLVEEALDPAQVALRRETREAAGRALGASRDTQILFGDLHVHTTYSGDAFAFSLPIFQGEGVHPPADACDFARFCADLDFWSINDHAESITPWQWTETKQSIRECNAVAGDPANPDLVSFLGWEWTQSSMRGPRTHYGHKNVVFRDTEEERVPTRPIGAGAGGLFETPLPGAAWALLRFGMTLGDLDNLRPYLDFHRFTRDARALPRCPAGVPVRDLPVDCLEGAETPEQLFDKLDDWGFPSFVVPHGTSWGIHAPEFADLSEQLAPGGHDPARQKLFEVYSGHGASEVLASVSETVANETGQPVCAEPTDAYLPCCWQAGELIRARCGDASPEICEARVERARKLALEAVMPYGVVPDARPAEWLDCGQPRGAFMAAFEYRPKMSAQHGLASRDPSAGPEAGAFRFGLIGSSDNHKARPGPGYKEIGRRAFGDAYGFRRDWYDRLSVPGEPSPEPQPGAGLLGAGFERGASFYSTAGLVAVHAAGRDRGSIFDALGARHAYGTSGPRILLWFDLENGPDGPAPMGSEVRTRRAPRFTVRAKGAFEQRAGCPDSVTTRVSPERLDRLCMGECHHPGDTRVPIERIEVVRIRPQVTGEEPIEERVDDPWRVFECPADGTGCRIDFEDPEYDGQQEFLYYVRALQTPSGAVNGDPLRCERDDAGRCLRARPCPASGPDFDPDDECLSPVRERAWSSPIWLRPPLERAG